MENLDGKCVVLGVTGGIAAYKMANVASGLRKAGADVHVIMTENATQFITPLTFETLTNNRCVVDTFARDFKYEVAHISLAKAADLILIAPATANVIAKMAHGIADDMLTTTVLASRCKKLVAPAMNHNMYHNPIVQDNIEKLKHFGYEIITPATGMLANGDIGDGRMPEESVLFEAVVKEIACEKDLVGKKVLISAGATREPIDPVRFITNHSSGKMGYALARAAMHRGAEVTVVAAHTDVEPPLFVNVVPVQTAEEMYDAIVSRAQDYDFVIKAAAVADYTPAVTADNKIKKKDGDMSIPLVRTKDILKTLGENKRPGQILCGFSMETENVLENSRKKLESKHCDMICANSLKSAGAGFGTDTNIVTLITKNSEESLELMSKEQVAHKILDKLLAIVQP